MIERTLVYASFPSPALVPRDVVFGDYATIGGVRETWTAVCYILTADFADMLPHDEDQMPVDGNPHPMPGQLQPGNFNWVMPQYPEIGWNNIPIQQQPANVEDADFFQPEDQPVQDINNVQQVDQLQVEEDNVQNDMEEIQIDDSIMVCGSQASDVSTNSDVSVNDDRNQVIIINSVRLSYSSPVLLQNSMDFGYTMSPNADVYGPMLPPSLQQDRIFKCFPSIVALGKPSVQFSDIDVFSMASKSKEWVDKFQALSCHSAVPDVQQISTLSFQNPQKRKRVPPIQLDVS
jgi:hypothetical protein